MGSNKDSDDIRQYLPDLESIQREADPAVAERKLQQALDNPELDRALSEMQQQKPTGQPLFQFPVVPALPKGQAVPQDAAATQHVAVAPRGAAPPPVPHGTGAPQGAVAPQQRAPVPHGAVAAQHGAAVPLYGGAAAPLYGGAAAGPAALAETHRECPPRSVAAMADEAVKAERAALAPAVEAATRWGSPTLRRRAQPWSWQTSSRAQPAPRAARRRAGSPAKRVRAENAGTSPPMRAAGNEESGVVVVVIP